MLGYFRPFFFFFQVHGYCRISTTRSRSLLLQIPILFFSKVMTQNVGEKVITNGPYVATVLLGNWTAFAGT